MAAPRKEIDKKTWEMIEEMCKIHCTGEEIAGVLHMDYDTLNARIKEKYNESFSDYIKRFTFKGKKALRRMQWESAEDGNITMRIWLGKQYLGQQDKQEIKQENKDVTVLNGVLEQLNDD